MTRTRDEQDRNLPPVSEDDLDSARSSGVKGPWGGRGERPEGVPENESPETYGSVYSVANVITVLRLVLIPFFFIVLLSTRPSADSVAFALFALAASTDWLDGMIARRTGTVTAIGKAIDPIVDRALIASGVVGLFIIDRIPLWVVLVLVMRDVYLLYGAWILERRHMRLPVTYLGKTTTAVLLVAFSDLILNWPRVHAPVRPTAWLGVSGDTVAWGWFLLWVGIVLSLSTAVQYTVRANRALRDPGLR